VDLASANIPVGVIWRGPKVKVDAMMSMIGDSLTVSRVYGEPCERDGVTVIPAALVAAGGGGGGGRDTDGQEGEGGGFGLAAFPTGAYMIKNGSVRWIPAVDVNRLLIGLSFVVFRIMRSRRRAARRANT
jgi:uncharacterized spore protein YtfJ